MPDADVVIVGAGQAGLAVSHELAARGVDHLVLERGQIGQTWRDRWESFCLVTPNWSLSLPGRPYAGDAPEGFLGRDGIVRYLEEYAAANATAVQLGVEVTRIERQDGLFKLATGAGTLSAKSLVLATGAYQKPFRPPVPAEFPARTLVIDAEEYRNPASLPPGPVLVIGSGQTGCQIAEETHEAGRDVLRACGRAAWMPRRVNGRDMVSWLADTSFFETRLADLPSREARLLANPQLTGRAGGHDLNYRVLQAAGVKLLGHFTGADGSRAFFAPDLAASVAFGDARYSELCQLLAQQLPERGLTPPEMPRPAPFHSDPGEEVRLANLGTVIFTAGFRPDYARWVELDAFDEYGFPLTRDGASTMVSGLYFAGVHFLRKRKSSLLFGVGEDAAIVATQIALTRS